MARAALFGRDHELGRLRAAWARARAGSGGLVVLSGEPGIGKSALAHALADEVGDAASVARGRAWEAGDAPAYFPLWPCLRALGIAPPDGRGGDDDALDEFARWEAVLAALVAASRARPVLWVIEDLHAADAQTLDLLAFVAAPLRSTAVLVVATLRSADARLDEATLRRIARVVRDAEGLALTPLSPAEVGELVRSRVQGVSDEVVDELATRTGGNPLFVVECARNLAATAPHQRAAITLPPTVSASVRERVELLPAATRKHLHDAAVLGDEAFSGVLARMADTQPATVIDALAPALRAGILVELQPGRFRFSHAVVREVIVAAQPAAARADAHARAARALASVGTSDAIVERAHHALASLGPTSAAEARAAADAAVALLVQQGTHDRAQRLFDRVLDACARGELPGPAVDDLLAGARLAHAAGNFARARERCLEALPVARVHGDARGVAAAALALGAELRPGQVDEVLVRALDEALAGIGPDEAALACRLHARRAAALQPAVDPQVPVALARAAIDRARALGDDALRTAVLHDAASAMTDMVPSAEMRALAIELLDLCRAAGDVPGTLRAYARLAVESARLGELFAFDAHLDAMLLLARAAGHPRLVWRALLLDSMRAQARGAFDESERLITQVEQLARLTDDPALALSLMAHRMVGPLVRYQEHEAAASIAAMPSHASVPHLAAVVFHLRVRHAVHFRDAHAAAKLLAADPTRARIGLGDAMFGGVVALAGTPAQCRAYADSLADRAHHHLVEGHIPMTYVGPVRWILAQLEAKAGRAEHAEAHYREALAIAGAHGMVPWVARLGLELGELLRSAGRPEGELLLQAAAEQAESVGLTWLVEAARRGTARTGTPPPTSPAPPRSFAMTREGPLWRVVLGERSVQLPDARGLELLARLVERPGEEIHVLVLGSDAGAAVVDSDAGELLDARAIDSYRARLAALDERLDDARDRGDERRVARLEREREMLRAEVARAVGLGGRRRTGGSTSERARVNVQRRLKDGIARIDRVDPEIGRYLRAAVRTGTYCTFRP